MSGEPWRACYKALQIFLRSIPIGCFFQVVGFGSDYQCIFNKSSEYNESSLSQASALLSTWEANLGGTEILEPLQFIYNSSVPSGIKYRRVMILTDGMVDNRQEVIALVKSSNKNFESSCMGIGSGVDRELVEGVAVAGGGSKEFATDTISLEAKVIKQLKRAMGIEMIDMEIDWGELPTGPLATYADGKRLNMFKGEQLIMYAIFEDKKPQKDKKYTIIIKGNTKAQKNMVFQVTLDASNPSIGSNIHALAARNFIKISNIQKSSREKIIKLSTTYGVSSPFASFVAVEEKASEEATENTMQRVDMTMPTVTNNTNNNNNNNRNNLLANQSSSSSARMSSAPIMLSGPPSAKSAGCCDSGFSSNSYAYERHVPQRLPSPSLETVIPKKNRGISLTNIVQEQKSDGRDLTQNFVEILGDKYNLETVKQAIYEYLKDISLPENLVCKLWATAIALALLETKFEQEQEKWNLLSTKSYNWMDEELIGLVQPRSGLIIN